MAGLHRQNQAVGWRIVIGVDLERMTGSDRAVIRMPHGIVSRRDSDRRRWLGGRFGSYGPTLSQHGRGGPGSNLEPVMANYTPGTFYRWLSTCDPWDIPVKFDHSGSRIGHVLSLFSSDDAIIGSVAMDRVPTGDLALELADQQPLGFSLGTQLVEYNDTGRRLEGLPVIDVVEARITEISLTPDPSDDQCWTWTRGGESCQWLDVQEARDRDVYMRSMRRV
jgi:hypothetical protein